MILPIEPMHAVEDDLRADPELAGRLATPDYRGQTERGFVIQLAHFDWNCPQHLTQRFTASELAPVHDRLRALEAENAALRKAVSERQST